MGENFGIPILDIVYLEAERRPAACDVDNLIKRSPWLHPKQGVIFPATVTFMLWDKDASHLDQWPHSNSTKLNLEPIGALPYY